ncbi:MAG: endonuclease [Paludibacter sp.]|nr:endonuclease [Paludibacter sp.]
MLLKRYKSLLFTLVVLFSFTAAYAAVPAGYYYFAKNKKQAALKTALHLYCGPMFEFDYGGGPGFTWQGFYSTDNRNDTVVDMYSNIARKFNGFAAVDGMHIEHSFPKSWWGSYPNNAYKDLFHLYPADASANESKNNLPLGEVTGTPGFDNGVTKVGTNGFENTYTDKCFEPADEYKGDFARSYFYISTVYENLAPLMQSPMVINNSTYPFWKPWAIDLLMKWNKQDPVSPKELARIETIYGIQGNRNPFIDYPDLPDYIWGADSTKIYPFPEETEPFLLTPRRGTTIDFGVILQNDTRTQNLHIQGANMSSDIQVSLIRNSPSLSLAFTTGSITDAFGFDVGIIFKPTAAGSVRDTLLIQGGGLTESLRIPVKALASSDFITVEPTDVTPVGCTLQWISDPLATNYRLNVYQGDQQAGDLIISAYVEGSSWNKAVELYNGTGKTVDLSKYYLQKQSNGSGPYISTLRLSGTLDNGKSYAIVHKLASTDLLAKAQLVTDSLLQFDGNDAIILVRSGVTIDMAGKANAGADVYWGTNLTLQRKAGVTHPSSSFNSNEWNTLATDSYSMLGNHIMTLASTKNYVLQNVLTGITTSYPIQNLSPENTYTYSIESMRSGVIAPAINTMQLHTAALDAPEVSEATGIMSHQFTANWGEAAYATGYLLNVFEVSGAADTTVVEGFDNVGAAGTPLPTGWTGNANAIYTTTTSSGIAIPSIQLRNAGEWIQTKTYPQPVSKLTFMYRFVTAITGASLIVDGLSNNNWIRIDSIACRNNSKIYPVYNFNATQGLTAFRFTFNKLPGGNFSIDDIAATYGSQDTVYVAKDKAVSVNYSDITGLSANSPYIYQVRATLGSSVSAPSEAMQVKTSLSDGLTPNKTDRIVLRSDVEGIRISGLKGNELIKVYTITGICLKQVKASSAEINIALKQNGIFIVQIQNGDYSFAGKLIKQK